MRLKRFAKRENKPAGLAGAIFVPLNTRLTARELSYAHNDSGRTVLINPESLADLADAVALSSPIKHQLVVGDITGTDSGFKRALVGAKADHHDIAVDASDPAIILYTSGTTGKPKGCGTDPRKLDLELHQRHCRLRSDKLL